MPYQGGGQVFQIDPSYFGLYGLGESAKGLGQTISESKQRKLQNVLTIAAQMKQQGYSEQAIADYLKKEINLEGELAPNPKATYEARIADIQTKRSAGTPLSPDEQMDLDNFERGTLSAQETVAGMKAGRVKTETETERLKSDTELDNLRAVGMMNDTINAARAAGADDATVAKLSALYGKYTGGFTPTFKMTAKDLADKVAADVMADPELYARVRDFDLFKNIGGYKGALSREAAEVGDIRAGTAVKGAQVRNLDAETAQRNAAATASTDETYKESENLLVQFGGGKVSPDLATRWSRNLPVSEAEQDAIDESLIAYRNSKDPSTFSAATALNAMSLAKQRGEKVSAETKAQVKAALLTEASKTGQVFTAVPVAKSSWIPGRATTGWDVVEVTPTIGPAGAAPTDPNTMYQQAKAELQAGVDNVSADVMWERVEALPVNDPRRELGIKILSEIAPREGGTPETPTSTSTQRTREVVQSEITQLQDTISSLRREPGGKSRAEVVRDIQRMNGRIRELLVELKRIPATKSTTLAPVGNK